MENVGAFLPSPTCEIDSVAEEEEEQLHSRQGLSLLPSPVHDLCMQRLFAWRMWTRAAIEPVCLLSRPLTQWASRVVAFIFVLICCAKMEGKKGPSISLIFHSCVNSVSWTHTHHQTNMDAHSWITWWIISLRWIHCVRNLSVQKLHFLDLFLTLQFLINNSF